MLDESYIEHIINIDMGSKYVWKMSGSNLINKLLHIQYGNTINNWYDYGKESVSETWAAIATMHRNGYVNSVKCICFWCSLCKNSWPQEDKSQDKQQVPGET